MKFLLFTIIIFSTLSYAQALENQAIKIYDDTSPYKKLNEIPIIEILSDPKDPNVGLVHFTYRPYSNYHDLIKFLNDKIIFNEDLLGKSPFSKYILIDTLLLLPCKQCESYRRIQTPHKMSLYSSFLFGRTFFESYGAIPPEEADGYLIATANAYLHQNLQLDSFIEDLHFIGFLSPRAITLADYLNESRRVYGLDNSDSVAFLLQKAESDSLADKNYHLRWHALSDYFIGDKNHSNLEFSYYVNKHKKLYPEIVPKFVFYHSQKYIKKLREEYSVHTLFYWMHKYIHLFLKPQAYFDNYIKAARKNPQSPWYAFLQYPNNDIKLMETLLAENPNVENPIYQPFYGKPPVVFSREDWMKLADWINEDHSDSPLPGCSYIKWMASKAILQEFNQFELPLNGS